ncbi:MAG: hypothetical protein Q8M12_03695, partial [bacterium]|nr:hypothetical protein [bacterium]
MKKAVSVPLLMPSAWARSSDIFGLKTITKMPVQIIIQNMSDWRLSMRSLNLNIAREAAKKMKMIVSIFIIISVCHFSNYYFYPHLNKVYIPVSSLMHCIIGIDDFRG